MTEILVKEIEHYNAKKSRKFVFPSGREIDCKYDGYEPECFAHLLTLYPEEEIVTEAKEMPEIWYPELPPLYSYLDPNRKDGQMRYHPDIYIKCDKIVVEVIYEDFSYNTDDLISSIQDEFYAVVKSGYTIHVYLFSEENYIIKILVFKPNEIMTTIYLPK